MRDRKFGPPATTAHNRNRIFARIQPHAFTALVGSVFLSLIASLTAVYLAVVLPSFDNIFHPKGQSSTAPLADAAAPEPWFGTGALSALTDSPPLLPVTLAQTPEPTAPAALALAPLPAPALAPQALSAPVLVIAGAPPQRAVARPADLRTSLATAQTSPAGARPRARPAEITTIAASMSAANAPEAEADPVEAVLAALALPASPRPEHRPARLAVSRAVAVSAPAPADTPPSLARLSRPEAPLLQGPGFSGKCSARLARAIPRRARSAAPGSAFIAGLPNAAGGSRDAAIVREALAGNVPKFLRQLMPVTFTGTLASGRQAQITICVTPDYLAIGSDRDYVRVPLGLRAAGQLAEAFNMMLPTTRMVDAIYSQAAVRLSPKPMPAGGQMVSTGYFLRHNATVQDQLAAARAPLGALVAGQKKDLVLSNRLASNPGRVAIYGWHRPGGSPIQPLSTVHGAAYADYSHGIRLVSRTAYLNGRPIDLQELLTDGRYARLINKEGVIGGAAIRIAAR